MVEATTTEQVVDALRSLGAICIGVDGSDGVGKTTLSKTIATRMEFPVLSLDDYLVPKQGGFLEFLQYDRLRDAISTAPCLVIEGVCLLQALERVQVQIDALVYVKRYHLGCWADERELSLTEPLEGFLARERKLVSLIRGDDAADQCLGVTEEIIRYHHAKSPQNSAQIIYRVTHIDSKGIGEIEL